MIIIGIDPGISGSICFFEDGKIIEVIEMPVMTEGKKNKFLMDLINNKINGLVRTTDDEVPSKYVESAGFAYLAYLKKGEIFKAKL